MRFAFLCTAPDRLASNIWSIISNTGGGGCWSAISRTARESIWWDFGGLSLEHVGEVRNWPKLRDEESCDRGFILSFSARFCNVILRSDLNFHVTYRWWNPAFLSSTCFNFSPHLLVHVRDYIGTQFVWRWNLE